MPQKKVDEDDFQDMSWQGVIDSADERDVNKYSTLFFQKVSELEEEGDTEKTRAYRFLGDICSMYMKEDEPNEPFGPQMITANGRTAALDDFTEENLDLLNHLLEEVTDPELKARIADILWTNQRDYRAAEVAFEAYL